MESTLKTMWNHPVIEAPPIGSSVQIIILKYYPGRNLLV